MTSTPAAPPVPLVLSYEALRALGVSLSRGQLSTLMRRGRFPRNFALSEGSAALAWWRDDVVKHIESQHAKAEEQAAARSAAARKCQETKRQHPEKIERAQQKRLATIARRQAEKEALQSNLSSLFVDTSERSES